MLTSGNSMESVNFVHDVNVLRKTIKSVYSSSADLRALNSELEDGPRNCRVQVLPVCWRHLLDFPRKREKKNERDIGDGALDDDDCESSLANQKNLTKQFTKTHPLRTLLSRAWLLLGP